MQVAEIRKGQTISGLVPNKNVTVINIEMYSDDQGELTYRLPDDITLLEGSDKQTVTKIAKRAKANCLKIINVNFIKEATLT